MDVYRWTDVCLQKPTLSLLQSSHLLVSASLKHECDKTGSFVDTSLVLVVSWKKSFANSPLMQVYALTNLYLWFRSSKINFWCWDVFITWSFQLEPEVDMTGALDDQ